MSEHGRYAIDAETERTKAMVWVTYAFLAAVDLALPAFAPTLDAAVVAVLLAISVSTLATSYLVPRASFI